jgi:hypothetical protein
LSNQAGNVNGFSLFSVLQTQISIAVVLNFGDIKRMLSRACSAAVNGINAYAIEVEANCGYGDTLIVVVGNN